MYKRQIQLNNRGVVADGLRNNGTLDIKADGYKFDASKFTNDGLVKVSNLSLIHIYREYCGLR